MKKNARYRVTDARVAPHAFSPGTAVRFVRASRAGDRFLFRGAGIVQWLALEDVEEL